MKRRGFLKWLAALLCVPAVLPKSKAKEKAESEPYTVPVDFYRHPVRLSKADEQRINERCQEMLMADLAENRKNFRKQCDTSRYFRFVPKDAYKWTPPETL